MRFDANVVIRLARNSLSFGHAFQSMQSLQQRGSFMHLLREGDEKEKEKRRNDHGSMGPMNLRPEFWQHAPIARWGSRHGTKRLYTPPTIEHGSEKYDTHTKRELHSLNVAIVMNSMIFVAKACVANITGSSSMLAEALHSIADVLNQVRRCAILLLPSPSPAQPFVGFRGTLIRS